MGAGMSKIVTGGPLEKMEADLEAENKDLSKLIKQNTQHLNDLKNATLDIAITGKSGAGKSTLVNALRGVKDYEEDAAETGVTQTTMETKAYPHPLFPKVTIWDLPGIGTPEFQAKKYLQRVNFKRYDFFIIVASGCFTEHDVFLGQEIHKMGKKFYYVRNKINQDMANEKRKKDFNKEKTLEKIKKDCCDYLARAGESHPQVFLISAFDLEEYDFPHLVDVLGNGLDELKRHTLITMLSNSSKAIQKKKKAAMEGLIWRIAYAASLTGNDRFPGVTFVCNAPFLEASMKDFSRVFGLDEASLSRLAKQVGKPVSMLSSAIRKTIVADQIDAAFVLRRLLDTELMGEGIKQLGRKLLNNSRLLGAFIGEHNTISVLSHMLQSFLDDVQEDAENVWAKAFENSEPQTH